MSTHQSSRAPSRPIRRPCAFTLLEIMIVITILVILIGMVTVGTSRLIGNQRAAATRATLENLKSLVAEMESVSRGLNRQPEKIYRNRTEIAGSPAAPIDIWRDADPSTPSSAPKEPLLPLGSVRAEVSQRYNSDAVLNTQKVLGILRSLPRNKTAMEQLPSNQLMSDDLPGAAKLLKRGAAPNQKADPPLVLDGWNNPIIFVPASGLCGVASGDEAVTNTRTITSVEPIEENTFGVPSKVQSAAVRPFWASAGPDGIFCFADINNNGTYDKGVDTPGGDDNIYSFGN